MEMSIDDPVQVDRPKKKKRITIQLDEEDMDVSELEEKIVEQCKDKKKKSKKKHKHVSKTEVSHNETEEVLEEESNKGESVKKKKKRKHKERECEDESSSKVKGKESNDKSSAVNTSERKTSRSSMHSNVKEESSLGVVDTSILKQAETNLGLPVEGEEANTSVSDAKPAKKKKKKKDKVPSETPAEPTDDRSGQEKALEYLNTWHTDKGNWKFNKHLQVKLLHILYDTTNLVDDLFSLILLYLEGLNGKSREKTKEEAGKILSEAESETADVDQEKEERARQIFQLLS